MLLYVIVIVFLVGAYLYLKTRPAPHAFANPGTSIDKQTVMLKGAERIRRSALSPDKLIDRYHDDVTTLHEAFMRGVNEYGGHDCLGTHNLSESNPAYSWQSYKEVWERSQNFASGLVELGIEPGQDTSIGVFTKNCAEWVITEQAANAFSMVLVPLYDTLGPEAVEYIVGHSRIKAIVADVAKLDTILEKTSECKDLQLVVKLGDVTDEERQKFEKANFKIESFTDVEKRGANNKRDPVKPVPADVATICYTSGTTGKPKGVIMSHANMIADVSAIMFQFQKSNMPQPIIGPGDVHISYLPLAHMFERMVQCWVYAHGGKVGFFQGNIKKLTDDIKLLRPTIFPSVPRLLNRVYDKVLDGVKKAGGLKEKLFHMALAAKKAELDQGIIRNNSIWDMLVFRKVQAALGGRVKFMITGAAPISKSCLLFLRCAFGCPVFEGYGQTETAAGATVTLYGDSTPGHVGAPLPCNEIKLADVPEMNYFSAEDKGEVCFRGPNVMSGYLGGEVKAIDADGWLHSGDIGRWNPNGTLSLIDRKKAIFKLAQGEYIAPEKVENIYIQCPSVAQVFLYGNSLKSKLVAVVVPDETTIEAWAKDKVGATGSVAELCADEKVKDAIKAEMIAKGKEKGLHGFEQVKEIVLESTPFSVENGLLTPTFKAKRPILQKHYQDQLDEMYSRVEP